MKMESYEHENNESNWEFQNKELPLTIVNQGHLFAAVVYGVIMVISAIGNLTVLILLVRRIRMGNPSRLSLLLIHLSIADLLVTFLLIPIELGWSITVLWMANDLVCRVTMFARVFGLYVSSFVVICIAVDRYYVIVKPLNIRWEERIRNNLIFAWISAIIASLPQAIIFHVEEEPEGIYQCVTTGLVPLQYEAAYFAMNMVLLYVAPLLTTIFCSTAALLEISRRSQNCDDENMRRSGVGVLGRAKTKTLKLSITIVLVFLACWTPYYGFCIWNWIDTNSAMHIDPIIKKICAVFGCTNSCANPIVYGIFNRRRSNQDKNKTGMQKCTNITMIASSEQKVRKNELPI